MWMEWGASAPVRMTDCERKSEEKEVWQGRGQSSAQLTFPLCYKELTDAALCSTLIGCDTQDQNEHQGKWNKTVNIWR